MAKRALMHKDEFFFKVVLLDLKFVGLACNRLGTTKGRRGVVGSGS